jgi:hypothetical protein
MHHRFAVPFLLLAICCGCVSGQNAWSQEQAFQEDTIAETRQQIQRHIENLGAGQFSVRERAATELMRYGAPALDALRESSVNADDPEIRDRVSRLIKQMSDSERERKIARFMAGKDEEFQGWPMFRDIMGDSIPVRELFVDVNGEHPDVLEALDGNAMELAVAMEQVSARIQNQMFVRRRHPTEADTIALMLPMSHNDVRISDSYEITMIGVLDRTAASNISRDARLAPGFRGLIAKWIPRCSLSNRIESLSKAMQWNVPEALPVALSTLDETEDIATLIVAMQTIARFGTKKESVALATVLEDSRATGEAAYGAGQLLRSEVRDTAIATAAILHQIPLAEVGFPQASKHQTYGFTITGIGYDASDADAARDKNYRRIKKLIDLQRPSGS